MKAILCLVILIFTTHVWAGQGMVIVLEAPLLEAPSLEARVMQTVRRGDIIYLEKSQLEQDRDQLNGFWETLDRNANRVYIPKLYIKLITNDDREFETPVNRFGHDPTDYRLEEPLPDNYPLYLGEKRRTLVSFGMGSPSKATYHYPRGIEGEEFISRKSFQIGYQHNLHFDTTDRLYFGGLIHGTSEQVLISFTNDIRARESRGTLGAGPYFSYDFFRGHSTIFTVGVGFLFNYSRHLITFATRQGDFEERLFNGLSLSSRAHGTFQYRNILPNINLALGLEAELTTPQSLSPQTAPAFEDVWNSSRDQVSIPLHVHYAFFFGVISTY